MEQVASALRALRRVQLLNEGIVAHPTIGTDVVQNNYLDKAGSVRGHVSDEGVQDAMLSELSFHYSLKDIGILRFLHARVNVGISQFFEV